MSVQSKSPADASIGELMSQLSAQTSRLVRDEMRLAQKELQQSVKHAGIAASIAALFSRKQADEITPPVTESAESVKADIKEVRTHANEPA